MPENIVKGGVGVIIARFQTPHLTRSHVELLDYVVDRHNQVAVLLGCGTPNKRNPLPFSQRHAMVLDYCHELTVLPIADCVSNAEWSANVDRLLTTLYPSQHITLYGGRDSFLQHYQGRLGTETFTSTNEYDSATELRKKVLDDPRFNADFRAGIIWASQARFPITYPVVDIGIYRFKDGGYEILMARKASEETDKGYRLVGGFVDPSDGSLERAAIREASEELGSDVNLGDPQFVGSAKISDWRYRGSGDGIMSAVFVVELLWGTPKASDDISSVVWMPRKAVMDNVLPVHYTVASHIVTYLENL